MKQLPLGIGLRADAVYDSFVAGPNVEALEALRGGGGAPLWLCGPSGCGKTHLLQAAVAAAGMSAGYLPLARSFGLPPAALQGFATLRLLCIDDIDAVAGDPAWEQALFRLFNEASESSSRLVFAARRAPRALSWRLADLGSRAAACVVYQLRELDDAGLAAALTLHAARRGLELRPDTVLYLLKRLRRDLKSLLNVLDVLDEASLAEQRRLTVPFIRAALERRAGTKP